MAPPPPLELFRKFIRFGSITKKSTTWQNYSLHWVVYIGSSQCCIILVWHVYSSTAHDNWQSLCQVFSTTIPCYWEFGGLPTFLVHSSSSQKKAENWKGPLIHEEIQKSLWDFCIILRQASVSGTHVCLPVEQGKWSRKMVFLRFYGLRFFLECISPEIMIICELKRILHRKKVIFIELLESPNLPYCLLLLCHKMVR